MHNSDGHTVHHTNTSHKRLITLIYHFTNTPPSPGRVPAAEPGPGTPRAPQGRCCRRSCRGCRLGFRETPRLKGDSHLPLFSCLYTTQTFFFIFIHFKFGGVSIKSSILTNLLLSQAVTGSAKTQELESRRTLGLQRAAGPRHHGGGEIRLNAFTF